MLLVLGAPCLHGVDDGAQRIAERADRIDHAGRDFGEHFAVDESVRFKGAQVVRQHLLADAGDRSFQFAEALRRAQQVADDGAPPCSDYNMIFLPLQSFRKQVSKRNRCSYLFITGK